MEMIREFSASSRFSALAVVQIPKTRFDWIAPESERRSGRWRWRVAGDDREMPDLYRLVRRRDVEMEIEVYSVFQPANSYQVVAGSSVSE
jgi:hypothetical protein